MLLLMMKICIQYTLSMCVHCTLQEKSKSLISSRTCRAKIKQQCGEKKPCVKISTTPSWSWAFKNIAISQGMLGFRHRWNEWEKKQITKYGTFEKYFSGLCTIIAKKAVMVHLTHHKYKFSHVGPGEVVQQLPHGPDILQHRSTDT